MADGTKTRIGRNRVNRTEPEFEEDEPATYEAASPIFVDSVDEDEYEDEPDVVEDDDDAEFVDDPGDADDEDEDEDEDDEDDQESSATGGLTVSFAKVDDGLIRMSIHGEFTADITEVKDGNKTVYNSTEFGGAQTTLKRALESVGRNTVMRAVGKAWTEANPKEKKKPAAPRSGTAARIDSLEASLAQSNAAMAQILALLEKQQGGKAQPEDEYEDEAPVRRTRIARS